MARKFFAKWRWSILLHFWPLASYHKRMKIVICNNIISGSQLHLGIKEVQGPYWGEPMKTHFLSNPLNSYLLWSFPFSSLSKVIRIQSNSCWCCKPILLFRICWIVSRDLCALDLVMHFSWKVGILQPNTSTNRHKIWSALNDQHNLAWIYCSHELMVSFVEMVANKLRN